MRGAGERSPPSKLGFFLELARLHGQVPLVAHFLHLVHLGFEPVDVPFFVFQQINQQIA